MNTRLLTILFACVLYAYDAKGQDIRPFVKGGVTIGLFDGTAACNEDIGHIGLNIGGGVQIPINKSHKTFIEPSLNLISKGNVYEPISAGGRVAFGLLYLEEQVDIVYHWKIGRHWSIPIGTGLYIAYGIHGKVSATNGITWFRGIPVGDSPSTFSNVVGANRWDAGWRAWTIGAEYKKFIFRWDFEVGFFPQFKNRLPYALGKKYHGNNWAMSLNLGYQL
jgi:hypothetical protein